MPITVQASPRPIAAIAALYAWRYSGSVWLLEPHLAEQLRTGIPDALPSLQEWARLPEWCVYVADPQPGLAGMWVHLEHDAGTGRPELRFLLDHGTGGIGSLQALPVYLDRPSVTEALADFLATSIATISTPGTYAHGQNVRGGELDEAIAKAADDVDALLSIAMYLIRPEADIANATRRGVSPVRPRRPMRDRNVWLVGASNT